MSQSFEQTKSGPTGRFAPDFGDIRKNLMLKDRKYFVTLGFFVNISFLMSQNFFQFLKSPAGKGSTPVTT